MLHNVNILIDYNLLPATPIPSFTTSTPMTACTCAQLLPAHNIDLLEGFYDSMII